MAENSKSIERVISLGGRLNSSLGKAVGSARAQMDRLKKAAMATNGVQIAGGKKINALAAAQMTLGQKLGKSRERLVALSKDSAAITSRAGALEYRRAQRTERNLTKVYALTKRNKDLTDRAARSQIAAQIRVERQLKRVETARKKVIPIHDKVEKARGGKEHKGTGAGGVAGGVIAADIATRIVGAVTSLFSRAMGAASEGDMRAALIQGTAAEQGRDARFGARMSGLAESEAMRSGIDDDSILGGIQALTQAGFDEKAITDLTAAVVSVSAATTGLTTTGENSEKLAGQFDAAVKGDSLGKLQKLLSLTDAQAKAFAKMEDAAQVAFLAAEAQRKYGAAPAALAATPAGQSAVAKIKTDNAIAPLGSKLLEVEAKFDTKMTALLETIKPEAWQKLGDTVGDLGDAFLSTLEGARKVNGWLDKIDPAKDDGVVKKGSFADRFIPQSILGATERKQEAAAAESATRGLGFQGKSDLTEKLKKAAEEAKKIQEQINKLPPEIQQGTDRVIRMNEEAQKQIGIWERIGAAISNIHFPTAPATAPMMQNAGKVSAPAAPSSNNTNNIKVEVKGTGDSAALKRDVEAAVKVALEKGSPQKRGQQTLKNMQLARYESYRQAYA